MFHIAEGPASLTAGTEIKFLNVFIFAQGCAFTVQNHTQARYWTVRYPLKAIATMMQLVHLSWRVDLTTAAMPVLMMINPWDRVINVTLAIARYLSFPCRQKKLVLFRKNKDLGRHVLAGDILAPEATAHAEAIIQGNLTTRS